MGSAQLWVQQCTKFWGGETQLKSEVLQLFEQQMEDNFADASTKAVKNSEIR
jgi:hypothetical protein